MEALSDSLKFNYRPIPLFVCERLSAVFKLSGKQQIARLCYVRQKYSGIADKNIYRQRYLLVSYC